MTNQTAPRPIPTRIHLSENDKELCDNIAREFLERMQERIQDHCENRSLDTIIHFTELDENGDFTTAAIDKADDLACAMELEMLSEIFDIIRHNI